MSVIVGIFEDQESVEGAIDRLATLDIDEGDIHVMTRYQVERGSSFLGSLGQALSAGDTPIESRLTGLGLTAEEAQFYEQELGEEGVLVAVRAPDDQDGAVMSVMREANGTVRT
jgi:hypothetical protein